MTTTTEIISRSEADTVESGRALASRLPPGTLVALRGDLGAGKTRFVRGMAVGLGHDPRQVSSPTYTLANEYDTPGARCPLVHIDAYRLPPGDDLSSIGWDHIRDGISIIVIEWSERVEAMLPQPRVEVRLEHISATDRRITIAGA